MASVYWSRISSSLTGSDWHVDGNSECIDTRHRENMVYLIRLQHPWRSESSSPSQRLHAMPCLRVVAPLRLLRVFRRLFKQIPDMPLQASSRILWASRWPVPCCSWKRSGFSRYCVLQQCAKKKLSLNDGQIVVKWLKIRKQLTESRSNSAQTVKAQRRSFFE
jgi:hypothetical protein